MAWGTFYLYAFAVPVLHMYFFFFFFLLLFLIWPFPLFPYSIRNISSVFVWYKGLYVDIRCFWFLYGIRDCIICEYSRFLYCIRIYIFFFYYFFFFIWASPLFPYSIRDFSSVLYGIRDYLWIFAVSVWHKSLYHLWIYAVSVWF